MGQRGPISDLKLPPRLRAVPDGAAQAETMNSKVSPTRPVKPADLPKILDRIWDRLVDDLDAAGLLSSVDGMTVELALRHYLAAVEASGDLLSDGSTTYDHKNERQMKNPASQVFRDHSTAFLEFAKQLGLSFVARARVSLSEGADDAEGNPFAGETQTG